MPVSLDPDSRPDKLLAYIKENKIYCIMNKLFFSFLFLGLVIGFSSISCESDTNERYQGPTLVCLGDSLTSGYGATAVGEEDRSKSYPAFLQSKIKIPVINAGVAGDTTSQGLSRVDADVLSRNPQIVIIVLGGNDLIPLFLTQQPVSNEQLMQALETMQENLQDIISKIDNESRKIFLAKFYTETMARQLAEEVLGENEQTALIEAFDAMFTKLATDNDITLIDDIWQGVWGIPANMSDMTHPNAAGYEIMATNIFNVMQEYLEANDLLR